MPTGIARKEGDNAASGCFEKRLAQYGAMSLAIAGAAMGSQAQGATVYWSGHGDTASTQPLSFNFFTGVVTTNPGTAAPTGGFSLARTRGSAHIGIHTTQFPGSKGILRASSGTGGAARLRVGSRVGPSRAGATAFGSGARPASLANKTSSGGNFFPPPQTGYVGVEFDNRSGTGGRYYGWVDLTVNSDYSISLLSFAYNNTQGQAITIEPQSSVPEPTSIALLALGAAGLALYRRTRKD